MALESETAINPNQYENDNVGPDMESPEVA